MPRSRRGAGGGGGQHHVHTASATSDGSAHTTSANDGTPAGDPQNLTVPPTDDIISPSAPLLPRKMPPDTPVTASRSPCRDVAMLAVRCGVASTALVLLLLMMAPWISEVSGRDSGGRSPPSPHECGWISTRATVYSQSPPPSPHVQVLDPEDRMLSDVLSSEWIANISGAAVQLPALPGERLAAGGLRKKHPLVFLPGIISTPLEVWAGKPCMRKQLRQRVWGEAVMARQILMNPRCWLDHIRLNASTGLDPDGVKLRPATGLRALESLAGVYSLWGSLVNNALHLGYDESSLFMASYDWRLWYGNLEERDRYLSRLKQNIEELWEANGRQRVVVLGHSMGALVWGYFQQWVHAPPPHGPRHMYGNITGGCDLASCIRPPVCPTAPNGPPPHDDVLAVFTERHDMCGGCACAHASWTDKFVHAMLRGPCWVSRRRSHRC